MAILPTTPCRSCPLWRQPLFRSFTAEEIAFMERFKVGEVMIDPGTTFLAEGSGSPQLYTVLRGQGMRYKTLPNGRRQVVNFLFPGDFAGLQSGLMGEMKHSAEARTRMTLCVFDRAQLWELYQSHPARAYDLTWIAAIEEHFLGETVASLGQRDAQSRLAWALLRIWQRLRGAGLGRGVAVPFPFRQQDLADALGLSLVHTNKSLARFRARQLCDWSGGELLVFDPPALAELGQMELEPPEKRPLM